jgi:hypothetical protein
MRRVTAAGRALASATALLLACGDSNAEVCGLDASASALFGAVPDAGSRDGQGVVGLLIPVGERGIELCSGAVIAPNVVLTARHCLGPDPDPKPRPDRPAQVHVGASLSVASAFPIAELIVHDERDLALAVLAGGALPRPSLTVLPLAFDDEIRVGDRATLAGYGLDENGDVGERRFVEETVVEVDDEHVIVDGEGESGACTGDSGGPLLLRSASGELRVAGVLSVGSASCIEIDVYQRVGPVADWLNEQLDRIQLEPSEPGGC